MPTQSSTNAPRKGAVQMVSLAAPPPHLAAPCIPEAPSFTGLNTSLWPPEWLLGQNMGASPRRFFGEFSNHFGLNSLFAPDKIDCIPISFAESCWSLCGVDLAAVFSCNNRSIACTHAPEAVWLLPALSSTVCSASFLIPSEILEISSQQFLPSFSSPVPPTGDVRRLGDEIRTRTSGTQAKIDACSSGRGRKEQ